MKRIGRVAEVLAWSAFFAFAALVLALRFWLLPEVERHRDLIADAAQRAIGQPVRIGTIEAGWQGLRPHISLADVRIYDAQGREALVLPSVDNVLSWRSLLDRKLRLQTLVIDGPRLRIRRDAAGAIYVAGLRLAERPGEESFTDWILGQEEIVVRNAEIEWQDEKRGAPPLALAALNLRLRNSGEEHAIGLTARPPAALGSSIELRAELAGRTLTDPGAWSGRVYAALGATDLAAWRAWIDYPLDVREGYGALRLWLTLENGALTEATADVALAQVLARLAPGLAPLELAVVQGRLQARALRDGYELGARGLQLTTAQGIAMQPTDFQIRWSGQGAAARGTMTARLIEFEPLARLAGALPVPQELRALIAELEPRGRLTEARLEWQGGAAALEHFTARARFADLGIRPWRGVPGFGGLSGSVEASENKGRLSLATRNTTVELPEIFPQPTLALDSLNGQVDWERQPGGGVLLRFGSMSFANAHAAGNVSGTYLYPGSGRGTVDVSATLTRADGARIGLYLPSGRHMGEDVRSWLVAAIVDGHASDVRVRLKGDLRDFPFVDPAKGQFLVTAHVEHGVLDYVEGWPRIQDVEGELHFERDHMLIIGRHGSILGTRLANVRVSMERVGQPGPHLVVSGQAQGPTAQFLKFIDDSPVHDMIDGVTDGVTAGGQGLLRLKLDLPLAALDATKIAGEFEVSGNSIKLHRQLPPFERATGRLDFTESGFSIPRVTARLFGGPIEVTGATRGSAVEIVASGRNANVAQMPFIDPPLRDRLSGTTSYTAQVTLRDGAARVKVESSLRGVTSSLPVPFAKAAGDALPLRVDMIPADRGARERVSVSLGRLLAAEVLRRRQGEAMTVQRAGVSLTPQPGQAVRLPERPGILVYGSLAALDADSWLALMPAGGGDVGATALDVRIGVLDAYGKRFNGVTVRAGADAINWSASVNADELSGDVSYRGEGGGKLLARLDRLAIPADSPGAKRDRAVKPAEMPEVDLVVERFNYRGRELGNMVLAASRANDEWRIERIAIVNPDATLRGTGAWKSAPDGTRSALEFQVDAANAGAFLTRVGFPNVVKGGKANLQGSLAWRGDPASIDYPTLGGELKLVAEDGQFLEVEPGIGKLVSLMSLQALPKRIGLDFRDVFSKGFQFDRVEAEARIEDGLMGLKDVGMRGSAAAVAMTGEVDLARETQNLRVRIVPNIGDTASTAIALFNPAVGIAAAIAQRALKNPLGQIFAYEYAITGTWSDPKPKKIVSSPQRGSEAASP